MRVNDAYFFKLDQIVSTMGVSFLIIPSLNRFIIQSSEERKVNILKDIEFENFNSHETIFFD